MSTTTTTTSSGFESSSPSPSFTRTRRPGFTGRPSSESADINAPRYQYYALGAIVFVLLVGSFLVMRWRDTRRRHQRLLAEGMTSQPVEKTRPTVFDAHMEPDGHGEWAWDEVMPLAVSFLGEVPSAFVSPHALEQQQTPPDKGKSAPSSFHARVTVLVAMPSPKTMGDELHDLDIGTMDQHIPR
ncbi:hypothetical protein C8J57DRAFT_1365321 [Mycena rebaudengoi]|nr:hypothetical protein C8J57DRAFT_1365321 [Mycena rebaudengoi]